jgi:hypothetical protein
MAESTTISHGHCATSAHTRTMPSQAATTLKRLRERTGLSVQAVADFIRRPKSTYASYEDKYKKSDLPLDLVKSLIPLFTQHGVSAVELYTIAGLRGDPSIDATSPAKNTDALSPFRVLNEYLRLDEERRTSALNGIAEMRRHRMLLLKAIEKAVREGTSRLNIPADMIAAYPALASADVASAARVVSSIDSSIEGIETIDDLPVFIVREKKEADDLDQIATTRRVGALKNVFGGYCFATSDSSYAFVHPYRRHRAHDRVIHYGDRRVTLGEVEKIEAGTITIHVSYFDSPVVVPPSNASAVHVIIGGIDSL